ncbi:hypothetical protein GGX14DRAFT_398322 [Mycena pura]|uniref:Uncharacterized protein n=1 Tax=Mycena pura TaxID=153505 RepID=A0AAD6V6W5_9AGAR|nr:hypothetical protein GGX14DRAFT_398322 [Mycena pura]
MFNATLLECGSIRSIILVVSVSRYHRSEGVIRPRRPPNRRAMSPTKCMRIGHDLDRPDAITETVPLLLRLSNVASNKLYDGLQLEAVSGRGLRGGCIPSGTPNLKRWGFSFLSEDVCAAMREGMSFAVSESESAARAHAWIAEAAVERENRHYVPNTASWARSALQRYSDPRLRKLERAAQRTQHRLAFEAQARLDPLPPRGLQYIAEARHLQRVRYAAGGDTLAASFAVCDSSQRLAVTRGEEWAVRLVAESDDGHASHQSPWRNFSAADLDWAAADGDTPDVGQVSVGKDSVGPGSDGGALECSAGDVIEAGADGCSDGPGFMITRTVSPEAWPPGDRFPKMRGMYPRGSLEKKGGQLVFAPTYILREGTMLYEPNNKTRELFYSSESRSCLGRLSSKNKTWCINRVGDLQLGQKGLVPASEVGRWRRGARRVTASSGKCGPFGVWRQWLRERLVDDFLDEMDLRLVRCMAMPVNAVGTPHAPGRVPPNGAHPKGVAGR